MALNIKFIILFFFKLKIPNWSMLMIPCSLLTSVKSFFTISVGFWKASKFE